MFQADQLGAMESCLSLLSLTTQCAHSSVGADATRHLPSPNATTEDYKEAKDKTGILRPKSKQTALLGIFQAFDS
jgi:hypothetical protein